MRFALVDGQRALPAPKAVGICPGCGASLLARCGTRRVWHWAHKGERSCDPWWEPETEWHRRWKDYFPAECQEVVQYDATTGEKHIADVRTMQGLVLEFQHSHLPPQERDAREAFYGNMVWIVDGTRLKRDLKRLQKNASSLLRTEVGWFATFFPEECFPLEWLNSSKVVLLDFDGIREPGAQPGALWCILPGRADRMALVVPLNRMDFITHAQKDAVIFDVPAIQKSVRDYFHWLETRPQRLVQYRRMAINRRRSRRF